MGTLKKDELLRRLAKGELLLNARMLGGVYDVHADSYDLTAGTAVWKKTDTGDSHCVETICYGPGLPLEKQPSITVQPGQMIFVITREDINMPIELSGTVYSRNSIALQGILGLNAGHVDPGYEGPIVIRLINLRATPWTLTLGTAIFTIVFQTLDHNKEDKFEKGPVISQNEMLLKVRQTADDALSNALFDLYANKIDDRLNEHYTSVQQKLREELSRTFLPRTELMSSIFKNVWIWIITGIITISTVGAAVFAILQYYKSP